MLRIVHDAGTQGELEDERVDLDELCRLAAREMIAVALEAERPRLPRVPRRGAGCRRPPARGRQRLRFPARDHDGGGAGRGTGAAGRRPPRKRTLHLVHPAAVHAALAESHRGAAAPLPARAVDRRLRAGALGLLRLRGRTLRLHRAAADRGLAGGARSLAAAQPGRGRLRLSLGRWRPLQTFASRRTASAAWCW